jgi:Protein of unknown function (DUF4197)
MKKIVVLLVLSSVFFVSCGQKINLGKVVNAILSGAGPLSEDEVGMGLKEALSVGINLGADKASAIDGYLKNPKIKIPFPPEVQKVETALRGIGLGPKVDDFILALNRGAEDAAKEAKPIFISAIKQLTIRDAISILRGDKNAATMFLKRTTSASLISAFEPFIVKSLEKTQATKYYTDIATSYNRIPLVTKINSDLKGYATQKAIDGLFLLVEEEEAKIRENPLARTSELLKRVFGSNQ